MTTTHFATAGWVVLTGVAIAAFTVHGVAVAIGHFGLGRAG